MEMPCPQALAVFAPERIRLQNQAPAAMRWDEHGGTFVLRVGGLEILETAAPEAESGIRLAADLSGAGTGAEIYGFASQHRLGWSPPSLPPAELTETPILAAFHVPGPNLFIYCEAPTLRVKAAGPKTLELSVGGQFRARPAPCQEADIIIQLSPDAMGRLLAYAAHVLKER